MKVFRKKLPPLFLALVLALSMLPYPLAVSAAEAEAPAVAEYIPDLSRGKVDPAYPDFEYVVENGSAKVIRYSAEGGAVTFPSSLGGYTVTSIGSAVFYNSGPVTSVVIPNTVKTIEKLAFYYSSSITSVTIPASVTSIGSSAFLRCTGLTEVTIPSSVTQISGSTFSGCESLKSITIPDSVKTIGNSAFEGCAALHSVAIPNSVTSIGNLAFAGCTALTSISISASVTSIGEGAFTKYLNEDSWDELGTAPLELVEDQLTSITVDSGNKVYDSRDNCNAIIETATDTLIFGCRNTTIPASVTAIGDDAFVGCTGLSSIEIPSTVKSLGSRAFEHCAGLTSVVIPASITTILRQAFLDCRGLNSVTIPDSVTAIEYAAFDCCESLKSVLVPASVETIASMAFGYHNEYGLNSYGEGMWKHVLMDDFAITGYQDTAAQAYAQENHIPFTGLDAVPGNDFTYDIDDGMVTITGYKGSGGSVTIPSAIDGHPVTRIGANAFEGCESLRSVTLPDTVTSIGDYAFANCAYLKEIDFSAVTEIGERAFSRCTKLSSVTLPDSLKTVGAFAFCECTSLKSVTIPATVKSIGEKAFGTTQEGYALDGFKIYGYYGTAAQEYARSGYDSIIGYIPFIGLNSAVTDGVTTETPSGMWCSVADVTGAYDESVEIPEGESVIAAYDIALWDSNNSAIEYLEEGVTVKIRCDNINARVYVPRFYGLSQNYSARVQDGWLTFTALDFGLVIISSGPKPLRGDADGDDEVSSLDATEIRRYCAGLSIPVYEEIFKQRGDVDGNGETDIVDATWIQRYLAKMDTPYQIGEPL